MNHGDVPMNHYYQPRHTYELLCVWTIINHWDVYINSY